MESAYIENWVARAIVDFPVEDATREWRTFSTDDAKALQDAEKQFGIQAITQDAFRWAGVYGGAGVLMITDQDLAKPLNLKKIKKGSLKQLKVLDRMLINGFDYNVTNILADNYMRPEVFRVNGGLQNIHHSHFVVAPGAALPMRLRLINGGWDDSQLRRCLDDIKDSVAAKGGIASLILEANVDTITRANLSNDLASGDMDEAITKRYRLFGMMKSLFRLALLDSNEQFDRKPISFGGLGEILAVLMEWTSGASGIPMTRLFGVQAKGLGDSGQGDMNNYNNNIRGQQTTKYKPFLNKLDAVWIRSTLGVIPDGYDFEFSPLAQPSDSELHDQRLADAQADDIRLEQKVVKPSQVARKLMDQGLYGIDESDITRIEEDESADRDGDYQFRLGQTESQNGNSVPDPAETDPTGNAE
ncbi:phage-associated protein, HI1409 family [Serratia quinivorans]|nr:phage-associated protein, HI1409 family [Serratia quinivorans]